MQIYDGPTVYSPVLSELSGRVSNLFSVTSASSHMTVRFTSNTNSPPETKGVINAGFLAIYSAVDCNC